MPAPLMPYMPLGQLQAGLAPIPTPLGTDLTPSPDTAPQLTPDQNIDRMGNEGAALVAGNALKPPQVPFTEIKTKINPETGDQTHTVSGMTDQFLQEVTRLTSIGRTAEGAYEQAVNLRQQRLDELQAHPILAGVGRIASLAAANYQAQGMRGRAAQPLVNAAGQFGLDTFALTPEQLAEHIAQLRTQQLGAETAVANVLERGAAVEQTAQARRDTLAAQELDRQQRMDEMQRRDAQSIEGRGMTAAQSGSLSPESINALASQYARTGRSAEEVANFRTVLAETQKKASLEKAVTPTQLSLRASGVQHTGNEMVDAMPVAVARHALFAGKEPNQIMIAGRALGLSEDYTTWTPAQNAAVQRQMQIGPMEVEAQALADILAPKDKSNVNPFAVTPLSDVASSFGRGGVMFRGLVFEKMHANDPNISTTEMNNKAKMLTSINDLSQPNSIGSQKQAYNTFFEHIGQNAENLQQLSLTAFPEVNMHLNELRRKYSGSPQLAALEVSMEAVKKEYEQFLLKGRALYQMDRETADALLHSNMSINQALSAMRAMGNVASERMNELNYGVKQLFGADLPGAISPESLQVINAMGIKKPAFLAQQEPPRGANVITLDQIPR